MPSLDDCPSDCAANPFKGGWLASESVAALRRNAQRADDGVQSGAGTGAAERNFGSDRQPLETNASAQCRPIRRVEQPVLGADRHISLRRHFAEQAINAGAADAQAFGGSTRPKFLRVA
jgi:hypothetical protein